MNDMVERVARIIAPSSWRVMDSEKASMLRKYKGKNVGWPSDQFQHKESMAKAQEIIAAMQSDTDLERIKRERDQAVKALRFYARENSWKTCGMYMSGRPNPSSAEIDKGNKARQALASIEGSGHE